MRFYAGQLTDPEIIIIIIIITPSLYAYLHIGIDEVEEECDMQPVCLMLVLHPLYSSV